MTRSNKIAVGLVGVIALAGAMAMVGVPLTGLLLVVVLVAPLALMTMMMMGMSGTDEGRRAH